MREISQVEALIEATVQAREVIREAHEVVKDLRREMVEARKFKADLVRAVMGTLIPVGQEAIDQLELCITEQIKRRTKGLPLNILCSKCGQTLALCADYNTQHVCGACGHKFMIRDAT